MNKMTEIAKTAIVNLQDAINNKDFDGILAAYDLVEAESFDWDQVPDYVFEEWDKLTDEGNIIIGECNG